MSKKITDLPEYTTTNDNDLLEVATYQAPGVYTSKKIKWVNFVARVLGLLQPYIDTLAFGTSHKIGISAGVHIKYLYVWAAAEATIKIGYTSNGDDIFKQITLEAGSSTPIELNIYFPASDFIYITVGTSDVIIRMETSTTFYGI